MLTALCCRVDVSLTEADHAGRTNYNHPVDINHGVDCVKWLIKIKYHNKEHPPLLYSVDAPM